MDNCGQNPVDNVPTDQSVGPRPPPAVAAAGAAAAVLNTYQPYIPKKIFYLSQKITFTR